MFAWRLFWSIDCNHLIKRPILVRTNAHMKFVKTGNAVLVDKLFKEFMILYMYIVRD